jgi:hypothetical protein
MPAVQVPQGAERSLQCRTSLQSKQGGAEGVRAWLTCSGVVWACPASMEAEQAAFLRL